MTIGPRSRYQVRVSFWRAMPHWGFESSPVRFWLGDPVTAEIQRSEPPQSRAIHVR